MKQNRGSVKKNLPKGKEISDTSSISNFLLLGVRQDQFNSNSTRISNPNHWNIIISRMQEFTGSDDHFFSEGMDRKFIFNACHLSGE